MSSWLEKTSFYFKFYQAKSPRAQHSERLRLRIAWLISSPSLSLYPPPGSPMAVQSTSLWRKDNPPPVITV